MSFDNKIFNHLIYIPTNTECVESIFNYGQEARYLSKLVKGKVYFSIIESGGKLHEKENTRAINLLKKKIHINIIHLTKNLKTKIINNILKQLKIPTKEKRYLKKILLPNEIAYGAGPNIASILASILNVDILHRRDSDTYLSKYRNKYLFPSELEVDLIGKSYDKINHLLKHKEKKYFGKEVLFIGSDYSNDFPLDYGELLSISKQILVDLKKISDPDKPAEKINERIEEYFIKRNKKMYTSDEIIFDKTGLSEMGVSCVSKIFKILPEMPITNTLGCDYMQKNLLYKLDYPVLYHNRRVIHIYFKNRKNKKNLKKFIEYHLSDIRFKILMRFKKEHNKMLQNNKDKILSKNNNFININVYNYLLKKTIDEVSRESLLNMLDELALVYEKIYKLKKNKNFHKYFLLANAIRTYKQVLIDDVINGIKDYCRLISYWKLIIEQAKRIGTYEIFKIQ